MSGELAGRLSQRIIVERADDARTADGLDESSWLPIFASRAQISNEGFSAVEIGQAFSRMSRIRIVLRAGRDVRVGDRVRWEERAFRIDEVGIDPLLPDRVELRCEEIRR